MWFLLLQKDSKVQKIWTHTFTHTLLVWLTKAWGQISSLASGQHVSAHVIPAALWGLSSPLWSIRPSSGPLIQKPCAIKCPRPPTWRHYALDPWTGCLPHTPTSSSSSIALLLLLFFLCLNFPRQHRLITHVHSDLQLHNFPPGNRPAQLHASMKTQMSDLAIQWIAVRALLINFPCFKLLSCSRNLKPYGKRLALIISWLGYTLTLSQGQTFLACHSVRSSIITTHFASHVSCKHTWWHY